MLQCPHCARLPVREPSQGTLASSLKHLALERCLVEDDQSSSFSDQAVWDNYQEKYLSEAYSEDHDSDAEWRLLNFGEDYRTFLDIRSEGPTVPTGSAQEPNSWTLRLVRSWEILEQLRNMYFLQVSMGLHISVTSNEICGIITLCDHHLRSIKDLRGKSFTSGNNRPHLAGVLLGWKRLKMDTLKLQEYICLQREVKCLGKCLLHCHKDTTSDFTNLQQKVQMVKLRNCEEKLLELNVVVHRFISKNSDYRECRLKRDVAELYRLCKIFGSIDPRNGKISPLYTRGKDLDGSEGITENCHSWMNNSFKLPQRLCFILIYFIILMLTASLLFYYPKCCESTNNYHQSRASYNFYNLRERPPI